MSASHTDALPLPLEINQIDHDWLIRALRTRAPGVGLRDFNITRIDNGTCTKIYMTLEMDEAGKRAGICEKVILKGGFEPHSRAMAQMHLAEIRGYRDVHPALGLPIPACFFADFDEDRAQGIVIMEDLTARDVMLCHPLQPHTPTQVSRRLAELARFHAKTWDDPELRPGGKWHVLSEILDSDYLQQVTEASTWQRFLDLPRGRASSIRFHDSIWMAEAIRRMDTLSARLPQCVVHGDTHLGNLYIEADGAPGFFDSLPHRWTPLGEVSYHLGCALDQVDRRNHERELVRFYLDELQKHGITPPSLDEAMHCYAAFLAFGFCIFLTNDAVWQPEAINTAYTARFSAAMIDNDTIGALSSIG